MTSINNIHSPAKAIDSPLKATPQGKLNDTTGVKAVSGPDVAISSLASRLSHASQISSDRNAGLGRKELAVKVQANIDKILYPLDESHKQAAALEMPLPSNSDSIASAKAATAYVNDSSEPNPFAGLSRDQLSAISNDESGTFTTNERRAAFMQAYNEEQAWRSKVVEAAQRELDETGKLTEFFKAAHEHFMELPLAEQVLYPANYATDLNNKIDLDFNYHSNSSGKSVEIAAADISSLFEPPAKPG